jgi:hypothetical protein
MAKRRSVVFAAQHRTVLAHTGAGSLAIRGSTYSGVNSGPGIGQQIADIRVGGSAGELIEHIAKIRPRIEPMPHRAGRRVRKMKSLFVVKNSVVFILFLLKSVVPKWEANRSE